MINKLKNVSAELVIEMNPVPNVNYNNLQVTIKIFKSWVLEYYGNLYDSVSVTPDPVEGKFIIKLSTVIEDLTEFDLSKSEHMQMIKYLIPIFSYSAEIATNPHMVITIIELLNFMDIALETPPQSRN